MFVWFKWKARILNELKEPRGSVVFVLAKRLGKDVLGIIPLNLVLVDVITIGIVKRFRQDKQIANAVSDVGKIRFAFEFIRVIFEMVAPNVLHLNMIIVQHIFEFSGFPPHYRGN